MEKKITKAQKFEMLKAIPAVAENEMLVEFITHELELLSKKNGGERKLTNQQIANNTLANEILICMQNESDRMYTVTDMIKMFPCCAEFTNQKVSAILRKMTEIGVVEKVIEKRKSYFRLAE